MNDRLTHQDVMRLLAKKRAEQGDDIRQLLVNSRKGTSSAYQAVVNGSRPRRSDRADQELAEQMSRQDLKQFWLEKMKAEGER